MSEALNLSMLMLSTGNHGEEWVADQTWWKSEELEEAMVCTKEWRATLL